MIRGLQRAMVTCYPFSHLGSAPQRFVVQAARVEEEVPS